VIILYSIAVLIALFVHTVLGTRVQLINLKLFISFNVCLPCVRTLLISGPIIGPILWGHSSPLCHALSLSLWTLIYIAIHQVSLLSHAACAIAIAGFGSSW